MKKALLTLLKIGVSAGIIAYLVWDAAKAKGPGQPNVFANLVAQQKHWGMLAAAWGVLLLGTVLTFVRWWCLVRALKVPCRLRDAIRIGFWGYLFNLAPLGVVGGDVVKAVLLARQHPLDRVKAVAAVLVDRVIGLYLLFIAATTAILVTGFWRIPLAELQWVCLGTFFVTAAGTLAIGVMLLPGAIIGRAVHALGHIPRVGPLLRSLVEAVRMYRRQPLVLAVCALMTVGVHALSAVGCYLIACGLPGVFPSLAQHFVIIPLSVVAAVLPLPMGPFEFVLEFFYTSVPGVVGVAKGQGLIVALVYRLINVLTAAVGVGSHLRRRGELAAAMHEVEREQTVSA